MATRPSKNPTARRFGLDCEKSIVVTDVSNLYTLDGY